MTGARKGSVPWAADRYRHGLELLQREGPGRARAIEEAIAALHDSLSVFNREQFAQPWAVAHANLAFAFTERREGDHDDNLEQAIVAYEAALEVLTRENYPGDWAATQNNLAGAYLRQPGARASRLPGGADRYRPQCVTRRLGQSSGPPWSNLRSTAAGESTGEPRPGDRGLAKCRQRARRGYELGNDCCLSQHLLEPAAGQEGRKRRRGDPALPACPGRGTAQDGAHELGDCSDGARPGIHRQPNG